ncbi:MAG TPA: hypothetical protein VIL78_12395, partial [Hanamia sp.]
AFKLLGYHHKVSFHATDEKEEKFISSYFGESLNVFTAGNFPNKIKALEIAQKEPGFLKMITIALISPIKNILLKEDSGRHRRSDRGWSIRSEHNKTSYIHVSFIIYLHVLNNFHKLAFN